MFNVFKAHMFAYMHIIKPSIGSTAKACFSNCTLLTVGFYLCMVSSPFILLIYKLRRSLACYIAYFLFSYMKHHKNIQTNNVRKHIQYSYYGYLTDKVIVFLAYNK